MKRIIKIFFSNLPLKVLSLLVAFLLWLNITSMQRTRIEFYVPVEIRNVPENMVITKIKPDKVLVVIEGYKSSISNIDVSEIKAFVDGKNLKIGNNVLKVKITPPKNTKIISVKPKTIIVKVSKTKK